MKSKKRLTIQITAMDWRSDTRLSLAELVVGNEVIPFTSVGYSCAMFYKEIHPNAYLKVLRASVELRNLASELSSEPNQFVDEIFDILEKVGAVFDVESEKSNGSVHMDVEENSFFKCIGEFNPSPYAQRR
mmetsp:Transcript_4700/g.11054  ORF Transcript_4700/g.11054 Transcript_4700/m.11054 type:complete len:131 (+) Transcript_4700:483-875(+)